MSTKPILILLGFFLCLSAGSAEAMQIFVKTLAGKTITLDVEPSDTVFENDFIHVRGDARFDREVHLEGPITEPKHATTKEYVDARIDTESTRAQTEKNTLEQLVQQQAALIEALEARVTVLENQ